MTPDDNGVRLPEESLASYAAPSYGDPTGERAIRNILSGADWSARADWKIVGPSRGDQQRITVLLDPSLALAVMQMLQRRAELKPTRRGSNLRARLKKQVQSVMPPRPSLPSKTNEGAP